MHDRTTSVPPTTAARAPLAYVRPGVLPRRPVVLTALAVVTLIYASLSFVINVASLAFHAGVWWLEPPPPKVVTPAPIPPVHVEPYEGDPADVDGLKRAERDAVVELARGQLKLPADRAEMLRRLLADVGRRVLPRDVDLSSPSPNLIRASGRAAGPDGDGPRASHWFVTSRGRVELSDFTATFALDGTTKPTRLVRNVLYDGDAPTRWSAVAIGEALDELRALSNGRMTAYQAAVVRDTLRGMAPDEPRDWGARPQVWLPKFAESGTLAYHTSRFTQRGNGFWMVPDGRVASYVAAPSGIDPVTARPILRTKPPAVMYWPGSRGAVAFIAVDALLNALVSAYLFVGAVLLLRERPDGAERLARFLIVKAPLLLLGGLAIAWWSGSLHAYWPASLPRAAVQVWDVSWVVAGAMFVYPSALLLVLRGRRVRRYLETHGTDPWHRLRASHARLAAMRGALLMGAVLVGLALLHVFLAAGCWSADEHVATPRALLHLACALVGGATGAALLWHGSSMNRLKVSSRVALLAVVLAPSMTPIAAQPTTAPLSPWTVQDLVVQARESDGPAAVEGVRRLARAGEIGQDALLGLLDGVVPRIGVEGVLDAIGDEWFDTEARWAPRFRGRALRLTSEWIELTRDAPDGKRIAALEALGADPDLEPLLRPLLSGRGDDVRRRAAALLLRINPRPDGVVRQLRRDLREYEYRDRRAYIIFSLAHLRPASDAALAQLLDGGDRMLRQATVVALLKAGNPLDGELLRVAESLVRQSAGNAQRSGAQLLSMGDRGRDVLIELSLENGPWADAARAEIELAWPRAEAVFLRRQTARDSDERERIDSAARRVLRQLNDDEQRLAELTDQDADPEVRAQALMLLANRAYASQLGPATLRLLAPAAAPGIADAWPRNLSTADRVSSNAGPRLWVTIATCGVTPLALLALLGVGLRRDVEG